MESRRKMAIEALLTPVQTAYDKLLQGPVPNKVFVGKICSNTGASSPFQNPFSPAPSPVNFFGTNIPMPPTGGGFGAQVVSSAQSPFGNTPRTDRRNESPGLRTDGRNGASECQALMLGQLIQSLVSVDLWPIPLFPATCPKSVDTLQRRLRTISVNGSSEIGHANCTPLPDYTAAIVAVLRGLTSLTTAKQLDHLSVQAAKTGLPQ